MSSNTKRRTPGAEAPAARGLAWSLWGLCLLLTALGFVLMALNASTPKPSAFGSQGVELVASLVYLLVSTIGLLIIRRHPAHLVGWVFCAAGVALAVSFFGLEYAAYGRLTDPGSVPAAKVAAWVGSWIWEVGAGTMLTFGFLLFPTGRLPSPRWRPVAWLAAANLVAIVLVEALTPGPLGDEFSFVTNPVGIEAARWILRPYRNAVWMLLAVNVVISTTSLILRLRGSKGEERQQIKWLVYASAMAMLVVPLWRITYQDGQGLPPLLLPDPAVPLLVQAPTMVAILGIPLAAGIAILKYHLYDIDVIINRTLVYGMLTAVLAAAYVASIYVLQQLLQPLAGESEVAVAGSTLAVAALFRPARRRVQEAVDRRFNRHKYDAAKSLEAFSARLREDTDLNTLTKDLLGLVHETMQPKHVSLWLRLPGPAPTHSSPARPGG